MASDDRYREARRRFDDLEVEQRARFLLEASLSTIAQGLEWAGQQLADSLDESMHGSKRGRSDAAEGTEPGPAEPETAQRQTPRNESSEDEK